jgi:hypothetical protein
MIEIGKYIVEDWQDFSKLTCRRELVMREGFPDIQYNTNRGIIVTCIGGGSINPLRYRISFNSPDNFLAKLYQNMFGDNDKRFPTKEEAMDHVDMFLDKLQKLKAFI